MIRELTIKNYKSILDDTIELGRINVFIGENGCGKTNVLEAVAMAAAAVTNKLTIEELWNRGIRPTAPSVTISSFVGLTNRERDIVIRVAQDNPSATRALHLSAKSSSATASWIVNVSPTFKVPPTKAFERIEPDLLRKLLEQGTFDLVLDAFVIYNVSALGLRGLQVVSRRTPLGIHGENLHAAIAALPRKSWVDIIARAKCVSWLDNIVVDPADAGKYQGQKLLQSESTLYFRDKFMRRGRNVFSAESVNEGILHILFYLTLFSSKETPNIFGIDNIDTGLNPQLCRDLVVQLAELATKHDKQALITTHNPAILDGLNLHDDEQRLFVVSRSDEGHTRTRRIKVKPEVKDAKYKLSELWMRGHLGGLPETF